MILSIKGCKYNGLHKWLAQQQQLSPDTVCVYPVRANTGVDMIENGACDEDNKKIRTNKLNHHGKNNNDKKNGAVGRIMHDVEN